MLPTRLLLVLSLLLVPAAALGGCGSDDDATPGVVAENGTDGGAGEKAEAPVVVPGTGIGGVAVGDDREAVVERYGEPVRTLELENEFSGGTNDRLEWTEPHALAAVVAPISGDDPKVAASSEVIQLETTDEQVRTGNGLGIGDSREDLEAAYPDMDCDTGDPQVILCRLGSQEPGSIVTDFFVTDDAITRIVVGRIID